MNQLKSTKMNAKKILNIVAFALAVTGVLCKANHWPGASIALILSAVTMLLSLFMFGVKDNKEAGLSNGLNYFLVGTLALFIVGIIFKIQHWPSAGIFVVIGYALAFLLPIIIIAQKSDFKVSRQFTVTFLTYFIILISLFPNNPVEKYFKGGDIKVEKPESIAYVVVEPTN
jgi:heme/copper-type cytochrome/quinol oxidase subunit 4